MNHDHDHKHEHSPAIKSGRHWGVIVISAIVALVFIGSCVSFQVSSAEYVLISRFGRVDRQAEPGLNFKLPYPLEDAIRLSRATQSTRRPLQQTALADGKSLMVAPFATWRIKDPQKFLQSVTTLRNAEDNFITSFLGTAITGAFSKASLADLVGPAASANALPELEAQITQATAAAAAEYGIEVQQAGVCLLGFPPAKTTEALVDKMRQERLAKAQAIKVKGEEEALKITSEAQTQARKILDAALADAERIRGEGESKAAAYYKVFDQAPELAAFLLKLEALRTALADANTALILDTRTVPFDLLNAQSIQDLRQGTATPPLKAPAAGAAAP